MGSSGNDVLQGFGGDDVVTGLDGDDTLRGGTGSDQLYGGAGNDLLAEFAGDVGPFGNDLYDGGSGNDRVSYYLDFGPGVTVDLNQAGAQATGYGNDTFGSIEHVTATYGDDTLTGNAADNWFWTFNGSDNLYGNGGNDYFTVGLGNKIVDGGAGNDTIEILDLAFEPAYTADGITVSLLLQGQAQQTGVGSWTLSNIENLGGWWGADELTGDANANILAGGQGSDTLVGGAGNDILAGDGAFDLDSNAAPTFFANPNWFGGNDIIDGGLGDDTISGNGGADTLTGGSGSDIFLDTAANLSGDMITDFGAGDRIVITDATLATFTYNVSGTTLTYTGGSLTLTAPISGSIVMSAAAGGGVQLTIQAIPDVDNDFNGDGRSDILFRQDNGAITNFLGTANGGILNNGDNVYTLVDTAWDVAGTGDFNGDGRDDVLFRNDNGAIFNLLGTANGGVQNNGDNSYMGLSSSWTVSGVGDFNGDGKDDILFRDANGVIFNYLGTASGGFTGNTGNLYTDIGDEWTVAGTGDFNGDGRDDILFRNDNGAITNFLGTANGGIQNNGDNIYTVVDNAWHIAGVGDFNGDGRDDILWRNDNGAVFNFLGTANGGVVSNGDNSYTAMSNAWHVEAIGDYNGDGRDDILWRHDDGTIIDWLGTASGGYTDNSGNLFTGIALQWQVVPADALL